MPHLRKLHRILGLAGILAAACSHAGPARAPAPRPEVSWPEPPAAPRARLALVVPDPSPPPAPRSFWRRLVDATLGVDEEARESASPLERPFGVAIGAGGELYVADPDLALVARVQPDGSLAPISCRGRAWQAPMALATAPGGELLVADAGAAEIVRIAADGACGALGAGALERPTGVAVAGARVYVADPPRHVVAVLGRDGAVLSHLGGRGEGAGQLSFPTAVAVASDGTVLVVDALNFRIARFRPDGAWLGAFGEAGEEGSAFSRPKGIAAGDDGRIYVTDAQRDLVLVFHEDGSFDYALGATGSDPGWFAHPAGVAIRGARLLVADSHNSRVQVFELIGGGHT